MLRIACIADQCWEQWLRQQVEVSDQKLPYAYAYVFARSNSWVSDDFCINFDFWPCLFTHVMPCNKGSITPCWRTVVTTGAGARASIAFWLKQLALNVMMMPLFRPRIDCPNIVSCRTLSSNHDCILIWAIMAIKPVQNLLYACAAHPQLWLSLSSCSEPWCFDNPAGRHFHLFLFLHLCRLLQWKDLCFGFRYLFLCKSVVLFVRDGSPNYEFFEHMFLPGLHYYAVPSVEDLPEAIQWCAKHVVFHFCEPSSVFWGGWNNHIQFNLKSEFNMVYGVSPAEAVASCTATCRFSSQLQ